MALRLLGDLSARPQIVYKAGRTGDPYFFTSNSDTLGPGAIENAEVVTKGGAKVKDRAPGESRLD
jgi:hypothetical protein